jgi:hypothetical protein
MKSRTIISLFDSTGNWSEPYKKAGYNVIQRDLKLGNDIYRDMELAMYDRYEGMKVHGIMAAVPCTDFANSGARWWAQKANQPAPDVDFMQFDNRLEYFVGIVLATLAVIEWLQPKWWVIENPRGRIRKLVPEIGKPRLIFQPWYYGDPYTKQTFLYGNFNPNLPQTRVLPLEGSKTHKMGSSQQDERSITPKGFSRAFFLANP